MDPRTLQEAASTPDPVERARVLTWMMTEDQGFLDAAARYRRQAIADAREHGMSREQIASALGVTPPRITQIAKRSTAKARTLPPRMHRVFSCSAVCQRCQPCAGA